MPGLDGVETARRIHEAPSLSPRPAVVLLTAHDRDALAALTQDGQAAALLTKPVGQSLLLNTLLGVFGGGAASPARPAPAQDKAARAALAGLRVLLVEDNEINRQVGQGMLERVGIAVTLAADGETALALLAVQRFDAVLMDIQMPGMDGYETTRRIRATPTLMDLPVIAMTAHALAADRERTRAAGMNDHVTKPIDPAELYGALMRHAGPALVHQAGQTAQAGQAEQTAEQRQTAADAPQTRSGSGRATPPQAERLHGEHGAEQAAPGSAPEKSRNAAPEIPANLPSLDVAGAVERLGGEPELYRDLLRQFASQYAEHPAAIRRAIAAGDLPQARLLAHSLRGVAANMGARDVSRAAEALELALAEAGGEAGGAVSVERSDPAGLAALCAAEEQALEALLRLLAGLGLAATAPAASPQNNTPSA